MTFNNPLNIRTKDESDSKVRDITHTLLANLPREFSEDMIKSKYPLDYDDPLANLIQKEAFSYNKLLARIKETLSDLANTIDGNM